MANEKTIKIPDIGGAEGVEVIEVFVREGDKISKDAPLLTLESDKASMEIPSPEAGTVRSLNAKLGDKVSEGDVVLTLILDDEKGEESQEDKPELKSKEPQKEETSQPSVIESQPEKTELDKAESSEKRISHAATSETGEAFLFAGPAVRRLARELGVNLAKVRGTGRKSRINKEDIQKFVKARLAERSGSTGALTFPPAPQIDFSKFGEIEVKPLSKIKRLTGENVHRAWVTIPQVTQFDEGDITELEAFRKEEAVNAKAEGYKLTILAFVCKIVEKALRTYPEFNTSLDPDGQHLIYKQYVNIGVAVETPTGLVVPVIKGVERLSISDIAKEMARLSSKARDKGLMPADMSGGCFTISSLGGIGGTGFTPIVNSPEVAILGLSRSAIKPIYINGEFKPRLMLPFSLSYDHRVIDGAQAARFTRFISDALGDVRRILL